MALLDAVAHERRQILAQIRPVRDKPVHALFEARQGFDESGFHGVHRKQRDDTDDGAHAHGDGLPIRQTQAVVEEFVFFVPQSFAADAVYGVRDVQEMLEELVGDVFIEQD